MSRFWRRLWRRRPKPRDDLAEALRTAESAPLEAPVAPMALTQDRLLEFCGFHGCRSVCHLRLFEAPGRLPVALVGQLDDNTGTSIANAAAIIARKIETEVLGDGRDFRQIHFWPVTPQHRSGAGYREVSFEVLDPEGRENERDDREPYVIDLGWVELPCGPSDPCGGFAQPSFQPRSRAEVEQLIGQALLDGRSEDGGLWCALLEETCYEEAGLKPRPGEEARGA